MGSLKRVEEIMTRDVITLFEEESVADIQQGMERYHLRHIPVVDGRKLVGLVTDRDILMSALNRFEHDSLHANLNARQQEGTFVAAIMTRDVKTVRPTTSLREAAQTLASHRFGCLPVTDADGTLVGIVTESDFLRAFIENAPGDEADHAA